MASSNYSFTVLAFLIVLASISIDSTASSLIGKKKHVHVVNNIKSASNRIYVHCKSRDNDLGDQYLPLNKEFQWSFRDNIMGTTLFFCTINWKNVHDKRRYGLVFRLLFLTEWTHLSVGLLLPSMAGRLAYTLATLVLLAALIEYAKSEADGSGVRIINDILPEAPTLNVHCKSIDEDLGYYQLKIFKMFTCSWGYGINPKVHWCRMNWRDNNGKILKQIFPVFKPSYKCHHECRWLVRSDGIYFYDYSHAVFVKRHNWHTN
ncbi:hypothetical protein Scep_007896 [Stephania cephalantha]|uniref:S-protein homolog n=1 Tax=Stephania cephalantha TaxID=152367 RepID=A0AAP0PNN6_9MAGN